MNTIHPTRQLLLAHGLQLCREKGLRGLKVREVATSAGVNLGSFVYHFGNREQFLDELVELWYAPMFAAIAHTTQAPEHHSAFARLQAVLEQIVDLLAENATLISHLLADALAGEPAAQRFVQSLPGRHPKLLLELIAAAQAEGDLPAAEPHHQLLFIMSALGGPLLLSRGPLQHCDWLPARAAPILSWMADPLAARQRLHWALQGIRANPTPDNPAPRTTAQLKPAQLNPANQVLDGEPHE
jgi:AcrR family transcriptional regulator